MLSSVDAIMRPLKIPPKFVPYMEKHRIYELFHELATELAIKQPSDPIIYLKQCLRHAAKKCDSTRIILFGPPDFEMDFIAEYLEKKLRVKSIYLKDICDVSPEIPVENINEDDVVRNFRKILKTITENYSGWVLVDVPRNKLEARALQLAGTIPTHVLEIVPSMDSRPSNNSETLQLQTLKDLRKIYENILIKIQVGDRTLKELAEACYNLAKRKKHCGARGIFRVALIGSRGSGCRSIAKHLMQTFNLVHVDFEDILLKTEMQDTVLGKELGMIKCRCDGRPNAEMKIRVVKQYLLAENCIRKGWVLTGYPITVEDFKLLDETATPPNRVVFIECNVEIRKERLLNRRYNVITGSKHNLHSKDKCNSDTCEKVLAIHPKDCKCIVERDIQEFEENVESLLCYAGNSASIINGNADERIVRERVESCLMQAAPCAPPRASKLQQDIDPMDIEFDPDDDPDPKIFNDIRNPESKYSFV